MSTTTDSEEIEDVPDEEEEDETEYVGECFKCSESFKCSEMVTEEEGYGYFRPWGEMAYAYDTKLVCESCLDEMAFCQHCDTYTDETVTPEEANSDYCYSCLQDVAYVCDSCDDWILADYMVNGYCSSCHDDRGTSEGCDCYDCQESRGSQWVHDYSYKPTPRFFTAVGAIETAPAFKTPYYGMELEISIGEIDEGASLIMDAAPDLVYLKEDGSVDGFELVTHPMTLQAAMATIPFDALRRLRNEYNASAHPNGIHVHVSREGFDSDLHIFKWMKLIYRNEIDVRLVARRDPERWAAFDNGERAKQKHLAKKDRYAYKRNTYPERYSAINSQNTHTFEVRVFRGSLRQDEIMASLELVAGSVEYTRQLTGEAIRTANGWSFDAFLAWAAEQGNTYENLIAVHAREAAENRAELVSELERRAVAKTEERARQAEWEAEYLRRETERRARQAAATRRQALWGELRTLNVPTFTVETTAPNSDGEHRSWELYYLPGADILAYWNEDAEKFEEITRGDIRSNRNVRWRGEEPQPLPDSPETPQTDGRIEGLNTTHHDSLVDGFELVTQVYIEQARRALNQQSLLLERISS